MRLFYICLVMAAVCRADISYVNCFASLPSDFDFNNNNQYQTSSLCYQSCKSVNAKYLALHNGGDCYCGSSNPASSESTSSQCNVVCNGYGQAMCGGESSYSVYGLTENIGSSSGVSSSGSGASSSSSSSQSSSASSASSASASSRATSATASSHSTSSSASTTASSSGSSGASSSSSPATTSGNNVVTSTQTSGGSVSIVIQTVTTSPPASTGNSNADSDGKSKKKPKNLGAIVGGVVGGVCGAAAIAVLVLLVLRRISKKREQERMEKEYQEAIKPVDFDETLYRSSVSTAKGPNPFDDARRISNGSLLMDHPGAPDKNAPKTLTVANPDA
ncbi:LAME_0F07822g1_1 [Lachancea meyersii CBS 8951]|uniref:LAME_0F07822g1_1 n=1 Tax=Lachancea meyersii CBS 8951 TaxID=1266667 RepID=A0A1G4JUH7_9SACH|nr:LAME_0F07822g1_1 [Lachancea meyersii CBS 8951]